MTEHAIFAMKMSTDATFVQSSKKIENNNN